MVTMGRSVVKQQETPDQAKEETLTPEEEREARALAKDFIERLEKSEDVTPLVKDLYVTDFAERLRGDMDTVFPLAATPEVAAQLSSDEILHAYAASINCVFLGAVHYMEILRRHANERAKRGEPRNSDADLDVTIEELFPPKLIELIQSDPALAAMLAAEIKEQAEESATKEDSSLIEPSAPKEADRDEDSQKSSSPEAFLPFRSVEQMRHYTSLAEQGVALIRDHINSIPKEERPPALETWHKLVNDSTDEEVDANEDMIKPRLDTLTYEFRGYPAGTRLIDVTIMMFYMVMVRDADGGLKVLDFHLYLD
jgi:hypothetical protein